MAAIGRDGSKAACLGGDDSAGGDEAVSMAGAYSLAATFLFGLAISNVCSNLALHLIWPADKTSDSTAVTIATDQSDGNGVGETNHLAAAPSPSPNNNRSPGPTPSPGPAPSPDSGPNPEEETDPEQELTYFLVILVVFCVCIAFSLFVSRNVFGITIDADLSPWELYAMTEATMMAALVRWLWGPPRPWHKPVLRVLGLGLRAFLAGLQCVARASGRLAVVVLCAAARGVVDAAGLLSAKAVHWWETAQRDNPSGGGNGDGGGGEEPTTEPDRTLYRNLFSESDLVSARAFFVFHVSEKCHQTPRIHMYVQPSTHTMLCYIHVHHISSVRSSSPPHRQYQIRPFRRRVLAAGGVCRAALPPSPAPPLMTGLFAASSHSVRLRVSLRHQDPRRHEAEGGLPPRSYAGDRDEPSHPQEARSRLPQPTAHRPATDR